MRGKLITVIWAAAAVLWTVPEGELRRTAVFGLFTVLVILGRLYPRLAREGAGGVLVWAALGLLLGLGTAVITLLLMAVKTGLHGHGPEYTPAEVAWVIEQAPLWGVAGLLAGLGIGLVRLAWSGRER